VRRRNVEIREEGNRKKKKGNQPKVLDFRGEKNHDERVRKKEKEEEERAKELKF
jgi:hypothetical protein